MFCLKQNKQRFSHQWFNTFNSRSIIPAVGVTWINIVSVIQT